MRALALAFALLASALSALAGELPEGFVDAKEAIPSLQLELRYFGSHNFLGRPVAGYVKERCVMTREAAEALKEVQSELKPFGLGLKIFDSYRPERAVADFVAWAKDLGDLKMKAEFYPDVEKADLFKEDYIASRSSHSRGSTADLTIVVLEGPDKGKELDMGSAFDFFSPVSWPASAKIGAQQRANRMLLQALMTKHGFKPYPKEWWHFTLAKEPFPERYFDFQLD